MYVLVVRNGGDEGDARFVVVLERRGLTRKRLRHHSCPNFKLRQECIKESFLILDVQLTMDYTTHSINFFPPKRHEVVLQGQKVANSSVMSQSLADLVTGNCQAGQRWPSSSILMYLAEYMSTVGEFGGNVQIIPFDESDVSNMDPIIDFVISKGSTYDGDNLFVLPRIICTNKDDMAQHHFCAIFQLPDANLDNLEVDLPYASIIAPFCRRSVGFKDLRGCVTNGDDWRFFLFVQNDSEEKGHFLILDETLELGDDLTGLPLLIDWVENCRNEELQYCRLFQSLIN